MQVLHKHTPVCAFRGSLELGSSVYDIIFYPFNQLSRNYFCVLYFFIFLLFSSVLKICLSLIGG